MEPSRESSLTSSAASFAGTNQGESEVTYSDARSSSDTLHLRAVHSSDEVLSVYGTPSYLHEQRTSLSNQLSSYLREIGETERRVGIVNLSTSISEFISKKNQLHPSSLAWHVPERVGLTEKDQVNMSSSVSSSSAVIQSFQDSKNKERDDTEETEDDDYEGYETSRDEDQMKMEEFQQKWMMSVDDKAWIVSTKLDEFPCALRQGEVEERGQELNQTNVEKERTTNLPREKLQLETNPSQVDEDETNLISQLDSEANKLIPEQLVRGMTFPRTGESPSRSDSQPWKTWPMRAKAEGPPGQTSSFMRRFLDRLLCRKKRNRPIISEGASATESSVATLGGSTNHHQGQYGLSKAQEEDLRFISRFYQPSNDVNVQYARWPSNSVQG